MTDAAPWGVRFAGALSVALCLAFAVTGPWTIGTVAVLNWQPVLAVCLLACAATLASRRSRAWWQELLHRDVSFSASAVGAGGVLATLFLLRTITSRYAALEINAWDFTISFDRPIEQTLHGALFWSDTLRMSMLGVHANWLMLAFVPLYAIVASPYWLFLGHALAIAGAGVLVFLYGRHVLGDDVAAMLVAAAFLLNRYTVRTVNHFVIDTFYPLGFLLLLYAFRRRNFTLGLAAVLLVVSIKEDAVLTLASIALVIGMVHRAWRWTAAILAIGVVVFLVDYLYVIPAFRGTPVPFTHYWGSFGSSPLIAAWGMLLHPLKILGRVLPTLFQLLGALAFIPLLGRAWFLAILPTLVVFASADPEDMRWLALHYSLPILGVLFAATVDGLARVARSRPEVVARKRLRCIALVLLLCALSIGSGYKLAEPRLERAAIPRLLTIPARGPVYVQGALFAHAGYDNKYQVLHHDIMPPPESSFLLCPTCNLYPFSRDEFQARFETLRRNARYRRHRNGDLWLFTPR